MTDSKTNRAEEAIYRADLVELKSLLDAGLDPNSMDEDGRSLLMISILASVASSAIVSLLLASGANVNDADNAGQQWTPLHFSARDHRADIVRLLLDAGADVDALDVFGNTPLWRAVATYRGSVETIDALLRGGADPGKKNRRGISPLDMASEPELIERFKTS